MSYSKISNNICIECGGTLKNTNNLNKETKKCTNCGTVYTHSDDMGPGCWTSREMPLIPVLSERELFKEIQALRDKLNSVDNVLYQALVKCHSGNLNEAKNLLDHAKIKIKL